MSDLPANAEVALYQGIRSILLAARMQVRQTVNTAMVQAYWQVGRLIVEGEQGGNARALPETHPLIRVTSSETLMCWSF